MSVSAIGSSSSGSAAYIQQLRELLFKSTGDDTQITKADLEAAATAQGGSVQQADNLYTALGGNADGSGSLSATQVVGGLQQLLDGSTQNQVYAAQSAQTPAYSSRLADLFTQADTDGNGVISQQDLANAVTSNGGTTQQADALFAALDTGGNGNLTETEFQSGVQQLVADAHAAVAQQVSASPPNGTANLQALFQQLTGGSGTLTQSELEQAFTSEGGTTAQADALYAQLDPTDTGSVSKSQFISGVTDLAVNHGSGGQGSSAASASSSGQATTTTQVNPDGSVTTTVTYPNGSTVTTTTPAPANDAAASNVYAGGVIGPVDAKTINALFSLLAA
jgi:Ca2+-binding EF-hand superfamily protein